MRFMGATCRGSQKMLSTNTKLFTHQFIRSTKQSQLSSLKDQCCVKNNINYNIISKRFVNRNNKSTKVREVTPLDKKLKMEWPKITIFGDSITRRSKDPDNGCWASMISHKVGSYFDVDTRGFEGYNSTWSLDLMPKLFPKSYLDKVELFIPFFGHNDSWQYPFPGALSVEEFEKSMRSILDYLEKNGLEKNKIIMITPGWYHHESFLKFLKSMGQPAFGKDFEEAKKYGEAVKTIARDNNLDVVDFFEISAKQEPLKDVFCDGVHLSREGARLLFDALFPVIEKKIVDKYKRPLEDIWHVVPFEQHPLVEPALTAYRKSLLEK